MNITGCTASRFGEHDYSQPPHSTPEEPLDNPDSDSGECNLQSAQGPPWCAHQRVYEIVVYQPATHEWIRVYGCTPCTASLRRRSEGWHWAGVEGNGIHSITSARVAH